MVDNPSDNPQSASLVRNTEENSQLWLEGISSAEELVKKHRVFNLESRKFKDGLKEFNESPSFLGLGPKITLPYLLPTILQEYYLEMIRTIATIQSKNEPIPLIEDSPAGDTIKIGKFTKLPSFIKSTVGEIEVNDIGYFGEKFGIYFLPDAGILVNSRKVSVYGYISARLTKGSGEVPTRIPLPKTFKKIGNTWQHVTTDGSRDKRVRRNRKIPLVEAYKFGLRHKDQGTEAAILFPTRIQMETLYDAVSKYRAHLVEYENHIEPILKEWKEKNK